MENATTLNIDLSTKDNDNYTAFHLACQKGKSEVICILMENTSVMNINEIDTISQNESDDQVYLEKIQHFIKLIEIEDQAKNWSN